MKISVVEEFLPIFLVIWSTFRPGNDTGKYLNDMRDRILDSKSNYTPEHKELIYEDWKGIFIADIFFCFFMFLLTLFLAWSFWTDMKGELPPVVLCISLSFVSIIRIIRVINVGWNKDRIILEKHIKHIKAEKRQGT